MSTKTENWKPLDFHCPYECTYCPECEVEYSKTPRLRKGWMYIPHYHAIWVCPDTDLFSDEVPSSLIESILKRASQYPSKGYVFSTRNVKRYSEFLDKFPPWVYLSTTVVSDIDYGCSKAPPLMVRLEELKELKYALGIKRHGRFETCIAIKPIMKFTDKFVDIIRHAMPDQVSIGKEIMGIKDFPTPPFREVLTLAKKLLAFTEVNMHSYHISKDTRLKDWPDRSKGPPDRFEVKDRRYLHAAYQVPEGEHIKPKKNPIKQE